MAYEPKEATRRILEFAKEMGIKDKDLAYRLGVSRQNITSMRKGLSNITPLKLLEFLSQNREIGTDWALYGEGSMFPAGSKKKMEVDGQGNVSFSSEPAPADLTQLEARRLGELVAEKDRHIQSLMELVAVYREARGEKKG